MPYTLVGGEIHLFYDHGRFQGSRPDGDSVWFKPAKVSLLAFPDQNGRVREAKVNKGGFVQLRFEAIDTLELHFPAQQHQELAGAFSARDFTLAKLGFAEVHYSGDARTLVREAFPHPVPAHILTRSIDPFGRPVSFVFAGASKFKNGKEVFVDVARVRKSVNAQLAAGGLAYPTFYTGLPTDLRDAISALALKAREKRQGVWKTDVSEKGASIPSFAALQKLAQWPKLYRRLASYFEEGHRGLGGFLEWLRADQNRDDKLFMLAATRREYGNLHDVVEVWGNRLRMTVRPEELIILPR